MASPPNLKKPSRAIELAKDMTKAATEPTDTPRTYTRPATPAVDGREPLPQHGGELERPGQQGQRGRHDVGEEGDLDRDRPQRVGRGQALASWSDRQAGLVSRNGRPGFSHRAFWPRSNWTGTPRCTPRNRVWTRRKRVRSAQLPDSAAPSASANSIGRSTHPSPAPAARKRGVRRDRRCGSAQEKASRPTDQ